MKNIKVGIVGLGRLGIKHAENLSYRIKGCSLIAACSLNEKELLVAEKELGVQHLYKNYDEMLENREIDAIFIASSSSFHKEQIIKALEADFHVFCEKPLALTLEDCYEVKRVVEKNKDKIVSVGLVRRYDPSYVAAKHKIDKNEIGRAFHVRSQTVDMNETAKFQIEFVKSSGGIFVDANIHDVDLARWYLGSEVKTVFSLGGSYIHKEFDDHQDADNVTTLLEFENKSLATISASRTAFHGHGTRTEILCTKGILEIGFSPIKNHVQINDSHGMRKECLETFFTRFEEAFLIEDESFIENVRNKTAPRVILEDAIRATEITLAMRESHLSKKVIKL